jgi:hypothetical protein
MKPIPATAMMEMRMYQNFDEGMRGVSLKGI